MSDFSFAVTINVLLLLNCLLSLCNTSICEGEANVLCGFPGKPTNDMSIIEKNYYLEGETVNYNCPDGFLFASASKRRTCACGSWTGTVPMCHPKLAGRKQVQIFSKSVFAPEMDNVVDGDLSTCLELSPVGGNQKSWLQISLGKVFYSLLELPGENIPLKIKIFVRDSMTNKTESCDSQKRNVTDKFIRIVCNKSSDRGGFLGGVPGNTLIIEDHSVPPTPFEICEIYAYGYYGNDNCGLPEVPAFGSAVYVSNTKVEYNCHPDYTLVGPQNRICLPEGIPHNYWPEQTRTLCQKTENSWTMAFICAAMVAIIFIVVSIFLGSMWQRAKLKAAEPCSGTETIPNGTHNCYLGSYLDLSGPMYEEVELQGRPERQAEYAEIAEYENLPLADEPVYTSIHPNLCGNEMEHV